METQSLALLWDGRNRFWSTTSIRERAVYDVLHAGRSGIIQEPGMR
jgi:hypothetical protein